MHTAEDLALFAEVEHLETLGEISLFTHKGPRGSDVQEAYTHPIFEPTFECNRCKHHYVLTFGVFVERRTLGGRLLNDELICKECKTPLDRPSPFKLWSRHEHTPEVGSLKNDHTNEPTRSHC